MPNASLSVNFVPPSLKDLLALLKLESLEFPRIDAQLGEALPASDSSWINATIAAQGPNITLPSIFPPGGGIMMSLMLRLSVAGGLFPLTLPRRLLAEVIHAVNALMKSVVPQIQPMMGMPQLPWQRLALAARLTLEMRAQGVCPMVVSNVAVGANLALFAGSGARMQAALNFAARMPSLRIPPFGLPLPQIKLAQDLAGMAALGEAASSSGLPPLSSPDFMGALRSQLAMLNAMPMPKLPISPAAMMALAGQLADLNAIHAAFGPDALTPAGIARINAMLKFFVKLGIPLPTLAVALNADLELVPELPDVLKGMETVQSSGAALAASMNASLTGGFPIPPFLSLLEALGALTSVLSMQLKVPPVGPCAICTLDLDKIGASLPKVPFPDPPKMPSPSRFF